MNTTSHNAERSLPFVFITGGCRSGKSAYAEKTAKHFSGSCLYIATAHAEDEEMRERVRLHQQARGEGWRLHEVAPGESFGLWQTLPSLVRPGEAVLFDCLSLWAASCMDGDRAPKDFAEHCGNLVTSLWKLSCPVVAVSNEVGMGVVPSSLSGRTFRDMAGLASQKAACLATTVVLMVSGIPLALKGELPVFE